MVLDKQTCREVQLFLNQFPVHQTSGLVRRPASLGGEVMASSGKPMDPSAKKAADGRRWKQRQAIKNEHRKIMEGWCQEGQSSAGVQICRKYQRQQQELLSLHQQ